MKRLFLFMVALTMILFVGCQKEEGVKPVEPKLTAEDVEREFGFKFSEGSESNEPAITMTLEELRDFLRKLEQMEGKEITVSKEPFTKGLAGYGDVIENYNVALMYIDNVLLSEYMDLYILYYHGTDNTFDAYIYPTGTGISQSVFERKRCNTFGSVSAPDKQLLMKECAFKIEIPTSHPWLVPYTYLIFDVSVTWHKGRWSCVYSIDNIRKGMPTVSIPEIGTYPEQPLIPSKP